MPVRLLNTSVRKWPGAETVLRQTREWCGRLIEENPVVLRVGLFGSYARGEGGVGSDLDLVVVVDQSAQPFGGRQVGDPSELPLGADLLIYTVDEWNALLEQETRFARMLQTEVLWLACLDRAPGS